MLYRNKSHGNFKRVTRNAGWHLNVRALHFIKTPVASSHIEQYKVKKMTMIQETIYIPTAFTRANLNDVKKGKKGKTYIVIVGKRGESRIRKGV